MKKSLVGRKVTIKSEWYRGEWGIIKGIIGDEYHVALWNGNEDMVFDRDEIIIKRER